jgi:hypothetical protein
VPAPSQSPIIRVDTCLNHFCVHFPAKQLHNPYVTCEDAVQAHLLHERPIIAAWRCTQQIKDRNLTGKERDGAASHGLLRLLGYVSTLKAAGRRPGGAGRHRRLPGLLATEAANAFAQPEQ